MGGAAAGVAHDVLAADAADVELAHADILAPRPEDVSSLCLARSSSRRREESCEVSIFMRAIRTVSLAISVVALGALLVLRREERSRRRHLQASASFCATSPLAPACQPNPFLAAPGFFQPTR